MTESLEQEKLRLSQDDFLKKIKRTISPTEMVPAYLSQQADRTHLCIYTALIPSIKIQDALTRPAWDLSIGDGMPGAVVYHEDGKERAEYLRYGNDYGIEPLVIQRHFHGIRENYWEISEEFRTFHNLFHDQIQNQYFRIDEAGNEHLVAIVGPKQIQIRLLEIKQFMAVKDMHLALMFDRREESVRPLVDFGQQEGGSIHQENFLVYSLGYGDFHGMGDRRAFSRLCGKVLVPPFPKDKSDFWGFAADKEKRRADFIIGMDDEGREINNTSDPDQLANFFGANTGQPNYLTPVHFRKQVLDKYYQQSGKYSVEDNYLRCGGLWGMQMDNHHDDRVVAWLGDLGRDLPYEEQLHWRGYNIPPAGGISEVFYKRQILAQFADSDRPEHRFSQRYKQLADLSIKTLGCPILLPLNPEDAHYLRSVRVPSTDEQKDFDDLILALAKILVDSINEKALKEFMPDEKADIKGSISRLERAFQLLGVKNYEEHIQYLRNLQDLRSSGSAHRKGSNYKKIVDTFGIQSQALRDVFRGVLIDGVQLLEFLENTIESGSFCSGLGSKKESL